MSDRLYLFFRPRIEPEHRLFQESFLSAVCRAELILLALWFLYYLSASLFVQPPDNGNTIEALPIVLLAIVTTWILTSRNQRSVVQSGLMISAAYLLTGISAALFHPSWLYFLVPVFIASITALGALIGGGLVHISAAVNVLAVGSLWFYARSASAPALSYEPVTGALFLIMSTFALAGTSLVLYTISSNMQRTLSLLNDRTQQLASLAHTDPLTQIANRRFLIEILEREFARARRYNRPLSLIYLDLDGFKQINDLHGHMFGDDLLRGVSVSMKAVLRAADLLARIGGDEFAVLLPETDIEGSNHVAGKLGRALASYCAQLEGTIPALTFCSGVSTLHAEDESIDDLLSRADQAMYLAKATGKAHTRLETEIE